MSKTAYWRDCTAKDPEKFVADLDHAMRTLGWGGNKYSARLAHVRPGSTSSGRKRFRVEFTRINDDR